jgi:hypothetical protein
MQIKLRFEVKMRIKEHRFQMVVASKRISLLALRHLRARPHYRQNALRFSLTHVSNLLIQNQYRVEESRQQILLVLKCTSV